jgi:hypothetical protein
VVEWLLLLGALFIALQMIFGMAYKALTDSFSSFSNSVRLAAGMPTPPQGQGVMSTIGRVATGAALGGLFGGGAGALAGGAGELLGAPLMASRTGDTSAARTARESGNVFVQNGQGTAPQTTQATDNAPASAFVAQAQPVVSPINLQPVAPVAPTSVMNTARFAQPISKAINAPPQNVSEETARAVSASKSLIPDER